MSKKTFVLSDEKISNSYGFYVRTEGIQLGRFLSNPIMLNNHNNSTKDVLGTWSDIRKENGQLLASPDFDTEDADGKEVVRKVNSGKLKAASIGIQFKKEALQLQNGELVLVECELMEASIVAVPSNANALALYNSQGEPLSHSEIQQICLSAKIEKNFKNEKYMDKELLKALGLSADAEPKQVEQAINAMVANLKSIQAERDALKNQVSELERQKAAAVKAELSALIDKSIKAGKINASAKESFISLGLEKAKDVLNAIPARTPVSEQVKTEESKLSAFDKMSWEELDRGNHLADLKANHASYYAERFKKQFGTEPKQ